MWAMEKTCLKKLQFGREKIGSSHFDQIDAVHVLAVAVWRGPVVGLLFVDLFLLSSALQHVKMVKFLVVADRS